MGGIGSGRHWHWGTKPTTSEYRSIDVRRWAREGLLEPGQSFRWQWSLDGEVVGFILVSPATGRVRLRYRSRDYGEDWRDHDYTVRLLAQPCHLGGYREWFACPARGCGRRVAILYGGHIFACRHCHQLAYPSQREKPFERQWRRADKIKARLGWPEDPDLHYGMKPKGMHWKTYNRLVSKVDAFETQAGKDCVAHMTDVLGDLDL